jgi:hypothetical protein
VNLLFIDTEFSDFVYKKLVSVALVNAHQSFYAENSDITSKECSSFVVQHIFPLLNGGEYCKSYKTIANSLYQWLSEQPENTAIVGDYQGDWRILCDLLEHSDAQGLPSNIKGFENVFMLLAQELAMHYNVQNLARHEKTAQQVDKFFNGKIEKWFIDNQKIAHHALDDAYANYYAYYETLAFIKTL